MFQDRVDMRQTGLWTIAHCNCHRTIELYNRRRLNSYQSVVKRNNLPREEIRPAIEEIKAGGVTSLRAIAAQLNSREEPTPRGGPWPAVQVSRVLGEERGRMKAPATISARDKKASPVRTR
jgi:hypothetical protein